MISNVLDYHPGLSLVRRRRFSELVEIALALWLALAFGLSAAGVFIRPSGGPPFGLLLSVLVPIAVFLAGVWLSRSVREFVLGADLQLLTGIQAWRFAGIAFIALYAQRLLPGYFAWPAGLGDIAIGLSAPWVVRALRRDSAFAASGAFLTWNILGILDLVVAISMGAIVPLLLTSAATGAGPDLVSTALMTHLPLVLVPGYLVPLFVILHLSVLMQARRLTTVEVAR